MVMINTERPFDCPWKKLPPREVVENSNEWYMVVAKIVGV